MKLEAKIVEARGFWQRLRGLILRPPPPQGTGLLFKRCNAIHTCFMSYPIDAVFLDDKGSIVKIVRNIKPWTLFVYGGKKAKSVVEMAASKAKATIALLAFGACALFSSAVADVMHVDFNMALTNGTDWTYSESGVSYYAKEDCLTLKGSGEVTSPEFEGIIITNITLHLDFATKASKPSIFITPITSQENVTMGNSMVANETEIESNHCWEARCKIIGFRIWSDRNKSGVHLHAADIAYISQAPYNLSVIERYSNALRIAWRSDWDVQSTLLTIYRHDITPESCQKLAYWDFSGVDSPSVNPKLTEAGFLNGFPGLSGNNIYYPNKNLHNGNIQIGTTSKTGYLCVNEIPNEAEDLLLTAYVNNLDATKVLPIAIVANGVTNQTFTLALTETKTRYRIPLEPHAEGSSLYLLNTAKSGTTGPVLITDLTLVSDFTEAQTNTVRVARKMFSRISSRALMRIPSPGLYTIEAQSLLESNKRTPVTSIETTVEETAPPLPNRTVITIL